MFEMTGGNEAAVSCIRKAAAGDARSAFGPKADVVYSEVVNGGLRTSCATESPHSLHTRRIRYIPRNPHILYVAQEP